MARFIASALSLGVAFAAVSAAQVSAADEEDKPFDLKPFDGKAGGQVDGRLNAAEARLAGLHKTNPVLAKYDTDFSGDLSTAEFAVLNADLKTDPKDPGDLATVATMVDTANQTGGLRVVPIEKEKVACAASSRFYVRKEELDISAYTAAVSKKEAKGASLAVSLEDVSDIDRTEAHGIIVWAHTRCLPRPEGLPATASYLSSWSIAPFLAADGVRSDDLEEDKSALKLGVGLQVARSGGWFDLQAFALRPYLQTDFRGKASAYGAQASWEPYRLDHKLNGAHQPLFGDVYGYWQFRLEADWLHVDKPGRTDLKAETDYAWLGGVAGVVLFPPMPEGWERRLKVYGNIKLHRDVNNAIEARLNFVGAGLNLDDDGDMALSLDYAWGEDRATLDRIRKTTLSINFKY